MADTLNLPGFGQTKKVYVFGAAAIVTGIVSVAWYRHSHGSAGATAADAGQATDTTSIDPDTGFAYGSAADTAALSGGTAGGGVSELGAGSLFYDPADGLYDLTSPYQPNSAGTSNTGPGTFTDDAYWTQYAIENVQGYSASQVQGAIAAVQAGQALTQQQLTIWQTCLAVAGQPPSPPPTAPHVGNGGGTSTSHGKPTHAPGQLHSRPASDGTSAVLSWGKLDFATGYQLVIWQAVKGTPVIFRGEVTGTSYTARGLRPGEKYGWYIAGQNSAGEGPHSGNQHFTAPKPRK